MSTATKTFSYQDILNGAEIGDVPTVLQKMRLGNMLNKVKVTFTALTGAAAHNITDAAHLAAATVVGMTVPSGETLPPIRTVISCRVTAATTASTAGSYGMTDAAGDMATANTHTVMGVAQLSDDGTTITFPTADVTAFILVYEPASNLALSTSYP